MQTITLTIDSREQMPLPFPEHAQVYVRRSKQPTLIRVKSVSESMLAGDYCLRGQGHLCIVETKRSAEELHNNLLTDDFRRANAAFHRLAESTLRPYLVCEFSQSDLFKPGHERLPDALSWAVARYGLRLWFAGPRTYKDARRRTAELVLRLLLAESHGNLGARHESTSLYDQEVENDEPRGEGPARKVQERGGPRCSDG